MDVTAGRNPTGLGGASGCIVDLVAGGGSDLRKRKTQHADGEGDSDLVTMEDAGSPTEAPSKRRNTGNLTTAGGAAVAMAEGSTQGPPTSDPATVLAPIVAAAAASAQLAAKEFVQPASASPMPPPAVAVKPPVPPLKTEAEVNASLASVGLVFLQHMKARWEAQEAELRWRQQSQGLMRGRR